MYCIIFDAISICTKCHFAVSSRIIKALIFFEALLLCKTPIDVLVWKYDPNVSSGLRILD